MSDLEIAVELLERAGIPLLLSSLIIYVLFILIKFIPKYLEQRQNEYKSQQEYYIKRQKQYDDQMSIVAKIAEQGNLMIGQANQVIAQSNEVIHMNTEAIKSNSNVHDKVITALGNDFEALRILIQDLKEHDTRAERMGTKLHEVITILKMKGDV